MAKKKRALRRRHTVTASVQLHSLTKAGTSIAIQISANGKKVGEMVIGRGSVTWYGRKWHNGRRISWDAFAQFMEK